MSLGKKILWRFKLFVRSIPAMIKALFVEPRKHPWRLILDILTLSFNKRYKRTLKYIGRYYKIKKLPDSENQFAIDLGEINIIVDNSLINNKTKLVGLFVMYFDLIYPYLVRFPIPILMPEGSYEIRLVSLEPGDIVIDAGANVGIFTFWASKKVGERVVFLLLSHFQKLMKFFLIL